MNINKVIIAGRLVKDPELKKIGEVDLCSFRIASNRVVGKNKVEKSTFIDVDAWGGQAQPLVKYLKTGSRIIVEGVLCQDTWDGEGGKKNSKIYIEAENVMFLDFPDKKESTQDEPQKEIPASKTTKAPVKKTAPSKPVDDEDIPF